MYIDKLKSEFLSSIHSSITLKTHLRAGLAKMGWDKVSLQKLDLEKVCLGKVSLDLFYLWATKGMNATLEIKNPDQSIWHKCQKQCDTIKIACYSCIYSGEVKKVKEIQLLNTGEVV